MKNKVFTKEQSTKAAAFKQQQLLNEKFAKIMEIPEKINQYFLFKKIEIDVKLINCEINKNYNPMQLPLALTHIFFSTGIVEEDRYMELGKQINMKTVTEKDRKSVV